MLCNNQAIAIPYRRASTLFKCTNSVVISIVIHQAHILICLLLLCCSLLLFLLINLGLKQGSVLGFTQFSGQRVRIIVEFFTTYVIDIG